jgi:hypothetical protein
MFFLCELNGCRDEAEMFMGSVWEPGGQGVIGGANRGHAGFDVAGEIIEEH